MGGSLGREGQIRGWTKCPVQVRIYIYIVLNFSRKKHLRGSTVDVDDLDVLVNVLEQLQVYAGLLRQMIIAGYLILESSYPRMECLSKLGTDSCAFCMLQSG